MFIQVNSYLLTKVLHSQRDSCEKIVRVLGEEKDKLQKEWESVRYRVFSKNCVFLKICDFFLTLPVLWRSTCHLVVYIHTLTTRETKV